jgi:hypothetical protein
MHLQNGQTVSLQETVIQVLQVLFDTAGRTCPLDVRIPHDRDAVQSAWLDGKIIA